jgi:hypothetical protein
MNSNHSIERTFQRPLMRNVGPHLKPVRLQLISWHPHLER